MKRQGLALGLIAALAGTLWSGGATRVQAQGAVVGHWKTWVLASPTEIAVPAPPADSSDQTKKELDELRQLQAQRSEVSDTAVQYYFGVPATQRWHDMALSIVRTEGVNTNRQ